MQFDDLAVKYFQERCRRLALAPDLLEKVILHIDNGVTHDQKLR
jgi:hypothetical protein